MIDNHRLIKILEKLLILLRFHLREAMLLSQKMEFFKAEGLISGWVRKIRNNSNFIIIRQSNFFMLCPINSVK